MKQSFFYIPNYRIIELFTNTNFTNLQNHSHPHDRMPWQAFVRIDGDGVGRSVIKFQLLMPVFFLKYRMKNAKYTNEIFSSLQ